LLFVISFLEKFHVETGKEPTVESGKSLVNFRA
jgi:hypothetical protein